MHLNRIHLISVYLFFLSYTQSSEALIRLLLSKTSKQSAGPLGQPLTSYYTNIELGTPPKTFRMLIDVNARDIWIPHLLTFGVFYSRLNYKNGYARKTSSSSIKEADNVYSILFEDCELTGKAYKDTLQLKDTADNARAIPTFMQRFLAISSASSDRFSRRGQLDGVLSLNPSPVTAIGSNSLVVNLGVEGVISEMKYGLMLFDDQSTDHRTEAGELTIGGVNSNYFLGSLRYHAILSHHAWEINLDRVMIGSATISSSQVKSTALISTSHNDIYAPPEDVHRIMNFLGFEEQFEKESFKDDELYSIDCHKIASSPSITFYIEGAHYSIPPESYIRKKVSGLIVKSETCYIALLSNKSMKNQWILGTNFLRRFYSVFDIDNRAIAFATLR